MKGPIISIKDLLAECVRKAYLIICLGIICAVALCGLKFVKDTNALKNVPSNENQNVTVEIELSEEEELQVKDYIYAVHERDEVKEYLRDSIYINCNPYNTDYVQLQYYVEGVSEADRNDTILAIRTYILGGGLASYISDQNDGIDAKYFLELLKCESMTYSTYQDNGIMEIIMYAESPERAKAYSDWIQEGLDAYMLQLEQIGIESELEKISEKILTYTFTRVIGDRDTVQNRYEEYKKNVTSLEATLSAEQLQVANTILGQEVNDEAADDTTSEVPKRASISIKYLILGAILGIGAGVALIGANYILIDTLKTPCMIKDVYGIRYFGKVSMKKQNIFEKLAGRLFYNEQETSQQEEVQMLTSKIRVFCEKQNITQLTFVGESNLKTDVVLNEVVQNLKKHGMECKTVYNMSRDFAGFCEVNNRKNVILIEMLRKTKYSAIDEVISLCKDNEIAVLGYFVFHA